MIVNGKALAEELLATLKNEITHTSHVPHLTVITCAPGLATQKYIELKKRKAADVGIEVEVIELPKEATTTELVSVIKRAKSTASPPRLVWILFSKLNVAMLDLEIESVPSKL